ncbi:MAG: lamin tail domain-containing protein, partial [Verrucomicrobiales bacterium]
MRVPSSPAPSVLVLLALACSLRADIVINEIHYDAEPNTACDEFIELHNSGDAEVDLSGWYFSDGIEFGFPAGVVLAPGEFLVVAQDPDSMAEAHGVGAIGPWIGGLSNEGDTLELRDQAGTLIDEVTYKDAFPWPVGALGNGRSMELIHPSLDNDLGGAWRASQPPPVLGELTYFPAASQWSYRAETSEPPADWNTRGFIEDGEWLAGQTPIGFGNAGQDLNT